MKDSGIEIFAEDVELEGVNKKTPLTAEYLSGGYFINTPQHASLLTKDGKLVYTEYFPPVTTLGGLKELAELTAAVGWGVDLDIDGNLDNINQLKALANGSTTSAGDQNDATYGGSDLVVGLYSGYGSEDMFPVFEITKDRISNS
ncbi:MAG: hypothetical protein AAFO07_14870, partial [Bacteroidota bacterium]